MTAPASHNARPGATGPAGGEAQLIGGRIGWLHRSVVVPWAWSGLPGDELLDREVVVKEVRLPASLSETERDNDYQRTLCEAPQRAGSITRAWPRFATSSKNVSARGLSWNSSGPFS